ncbi:hypothetical protein, partial [Dokdonella sp.]|uniref:hypothetical protein n=1 Tax=Dokdonella sp. TaxID=2291710 RepID=UPI003C50EC20
MSAACLALGATGPAFADEGGVPFWFSGTYASLAAVPATPGWTLPVQGYYYSGEASETTSFPLGESVNVGLRSRSPLVLLQPTYAPETKVLGGQVSLGVGFGYGLNTTKADISVSSGGTELERSDTIHGGTDLYPIASIAWNHGVNNSMVYI